MKKRSQALPDSLEVHGGVDGTRTHGLRRDRQRTAFYPVLSLFIHLDINTLNYSHYQLDLLYMFMLCYPKVYFRGWI